MRNIFKIAALFGAMLLLTVAGGFAQSQAFVWTTTSAAVKATDATVTLTAITGVSTSPQTTLYVEGEEMFVTGLNTTTYVVNVTRQNPRAHASGVPVVIGRPNWFAGLTAVKPYLSTGLAYLTNVPLDNTALGSYGSDTSTVAGTIFTTEIWVPQNMIPKGMGVLFGTTTSTDKYIYALFDEAGTLVANTALAGTAYSGSANTWHEIAFAVTSAIQGPKRYFASVQCNGTTSHIRTLATGLQLRLAKSATGTFGTLTLTPPVSFTQNTGPYVYLY